VIFLSRVLFEGQFINSLYIIFGFLFILSQIPFFFKYNRFYQLLWLLLLLFLGIHFILGVQIGLLLWFNLFISIFFVHAIDRGGLNPSAGYFLFYLTVTFIVIRTLMGFTADQVFIGSKNSLSAILMSNFMIILFLDRQHQRHLPIVPVFFITFFSLWGTGRSGMIMSAILVLAIVVELLKYLKRKVVLKKHLIVIIVSVILFSLWASQIYQFINSSSLRLQVKGFESQDRLIMILAYLAQLTPHKLVFGSDLSSIPEIAFQHSNPHNFYIFFHSHFGLIALIMFIMVLAYLWKLFKNDYTVYAITILAFLLRIGTDTGARSLSFFVFLMIVFESCKMFYLKRTKRKYNPI
jgi:hypothetical protein